MSIFKKEINNQCYECLGKGSIIQKGIPGVICPTCNGTGVWKDSICYYIDDDKKICFDGEAGQ